MGKSKRIGQAERAQSAVNNATSGMRGARAE